MRGKIAMITSAVAAVALFGGTGATLSAERDRPR